MPRKLFNADNLEEARIVSSLSDPEAFPNSISACGCLFYKRQQGSTYVLLISYDNPKKPLFDDLGGKIEVEDATVQDAMLREVWEETNHILDRKTVLHVLNTQPIHTYYNKTSKYYVSAVEVPEDFYPDTSVFGSREVGNGYARTIQWFPLKEVEQKLARRLPLELVQDLNDISHYGV